MCSLLWIIIVLSGFIQDSVYVYIQGGGFESQYTTERIFYSKDYENIETLSSNFTIMGKLVYSEGMIEQNYELDQIARI